MLVGRRSGAFLLGLVLDELREPRLVLWDHVLLVCSAKCGDQKQRYGCIDCYLRPRTRQRERLRIDSLSPQETVRKIPAQRQ
jgi:hypothetical protein